MFRRTRSLAVTAGPRRPSPLFSQPDGKNRRGGGKPPDEAEVLGHVTAIPVRRMLTAGKFDAALPPGVSEEEWLHVLTACGRALASGSLPALIRTLS